MLDPLSLAAIVLGVILLLIFVSIFLKGRNDLEKGVLFGAIVVLALGFTGFLAGTTIIKNIKSETNGPVHWHADFQIWKCGQELKLKSPTGLSNRIGTPLLHEHGDNRIHVEGAVANLANVNLGHFFEVIGGNLISGELKIPTDSGEETLKSGTSCGTDIATLQVYVYSVNGQLLEQKKLDNPQDFILAPQTIVPPGNCIIIELDKPKDRTGKLCESYQVAKEKGQIYGR